MRSGFDRARTTAAQIREFECDRSNPVDRIVPVGIVNLGSSKTGQTQRSLYLLNLDEWFIFAGAVT